ncbi:MAG: hypothetical protein KBE04_01830 [Phycisphaerae bacterium]|nr:hypothetical protein [Phycisphaerae bacterium]
MGWTRTTVVAVLGAMLLGSCKAPSKEPQPVSLGDEGTPQVARTRDEVVADCIHTIHVRLLSLRDRYPQLSEIDQARVTATSLSYQKGRERGPKKQQWSRPDGCLILVSLMKYSPTNTNQTGAIRRFPEHGIQVYYLVQPTRRDPEGFFTTVHSIIEEEVSHLKAALSLVDAPERSSALSDGL